MSKRGRYKVKPKTPEEVERKRIAHNKRQAEYYHAHAKECQARVTKWKHENVEHMRQKQNGYYISSVLKSIKGKAKND